jgi:hypothetical protein
MLRLSQPEVAKRLLGLAEEDIARRWRLYEYMSGQPGHVNEPADAAKPAQAESKEEKK